MSHVINVMRTNRKVTLYIVLTPAVFLNGMWLNGIIIILDMFRHIFDIVLFLLDQFDFSKVSHSIDALDIFHVKAYLSSNSMKLITNSIYHKMLLKSIRLNNNQAIEKSIQNIKVSEKPQQYQKASPKGWIPKHISVK